MRFFLAIGLLGGLISTQYAFPGKAQQTQQTDVSESVPLDGLPALQAAPGGKSTLMGGEIEDIDAVRDQFILNVPGGRSIKLLFDARTRIFSDGVKIAPGDLHAGDHASVETVLDGTHVFALSIHTLSRLPAGECEGQVVQYDPRGRELTVISRLSHESIRLLVPPSAQIVRQGQKISAPGASAASFLPSGTLLSVRFEPDSRGSGVASRIVILASPGEAFEFQGNISSLDVHAGLFVLVDSNEDKSYQLTFDPANFPSSRSLHRGEHVKVTASFDGIHYVVTSIEVG